MTKITIDFQDKLSKVKSRGEFVDLINNLRNLFISEKVKAIPIRNFTYYADPQLSKRRCKIFKITKKAGGERIIHSPILSYKTILEGLNLFFSQFYQAHPNATGFVEGKSILDNATPHIGKKYILNIDLKDFFHSFDRTQVKWALMNAPFYLKGEREPLAFFIASLCTHPIKIDGEIKYVLPQGSPCSPILSNILCRKLDKKLKLLAREYNASYTRYADDITFSSDNHAMEKKKFFNKVEEIVKSERLTINTKKIRLQKDGYRKDVTGIVVNEKANLPKKYIKQLRMWLYYWEKYGYNKAESFFRNDYIRERGHKLKYTPIMSSVIGGKLNFLKMVKGEQDSTYKKLQSRYEILMNSFQYRPK